MCLCCFRMYVRCSGATDHDSYTCVSPRKFARNTHLWDKANPMYTVRPAPKCVTHAAGGPGMMLLLREISPSSLSWSGLARRTERVAIWVARRHRMPTLGNFTEPTITRTEERLGTEWDLACASNTPGSVKVRLKKGRVIFTPDVVRPSCPWPPHEMDCGRSAGPTPMPLPVVTEKPGAQVQRNNHTPPRPRKREPRIR